MIILLNGAPSSGKDTLANYLESDFILHWKYANKVRECAQVFYPQIDWWDDSIKDLPNKDLKGKSPRQILIKIGLSMRSEIDKDIWVDALANEIVQYEQEYGNHTYVISDCGFQNEVDVMVDRFGVDNVLLVRIYREGFTFENDSRNYVNNTCAYLDMTNEDKDGFLGISAHYINSWLEYHNKTEHKAA